MELSNAQAFGIVVLMAITLFIVGRYIHVHWPSAEDRKKSDDGRRM